MDEFRSKVSNVNIRGMKLHNFAKEDMDNALIICQRDRSRVWLWHLLQSGRKLWTILRSRGAFPLVAWQEEILDNRTQLPSQQIKSLNNARNSRDVLNNPNLSRYPGSKILRSKARKHLHGKLSSNRITQFWTECLIRDLVRLPR